MIFSRYIGIDYSGAETPTSSLKGLRVFIATRDSPQREELPAPSARKYWTRKGIAEWLVARLREPIRTIVGIDHPFSFPRPYFRRHRLSGDWSEFLDDFQRHWPTDSEHMYVDFVRDEHRGAGHQRTGDRRWRRLTDIVAGSAKSPFHFDVTGSVAKSTHAGLPWLRHVRQHAQPFFWPFDGWEIPPGRSAVVEVYPRLWNGGPRPVGWTGDQFDAFVIARWLRAADEDGRLEHALAPSEDAEVREIAGIEGWILGLDLKDATPGIRAKYAECATRRRRSPESHRGAPAQLLRARPGMPEISRFYGIVIAMYYREHGTPHFHVSYSGSEASVEIASGHVRGGLPPRARSLVLDWLVLHRAELLHNWERARNRKPLQPIAPLE